MGDPLSNQRIPNRQAPVSTVASSGTNNVSDNRGVVEVDARPRPATGTGASARKFHLAGVASFLQEFPSLGDFRREFPELGNLTLPKWVDRESMVTFDYLLKTILTPEHHRDLKGRHASMDILLGLAELSLRDEAVPKQKQRHGKSEAEDRPSEDKRGAGRLRRPRATLPNYLMNREAGSRPHPGDGLPHRFAAVRQDRLASTAIAMNCESEMLKDAYEDEFESHLKLIEDEYPEHGEIMEQCRKQISIAFAYPGASIFNSLGEFLSIDAKTRHFFRTLVHYECILRLYREASGERFLLKDGEAANPDTGIQISHSEAEQRLKALLSRIVAEISREFLPSMLIFEQARPEFRDRSPLDRIFMACLLSLHTKGCPAEAEAVFQSGLKTLPPDVAAADMKEDTGRSREARLYSMDVLALFSKMGGKADTYKIVELISFYSHLCQEHRCSSPEAMAPALVRLLDRPGPRHSILA